MKRVVKGEVYNTPRKGWAFSIKTRPDIFQVVSTGYKTKSEALVELRNRKQEAYNYLHGSRAASL